MKIRNENNKKPSPLLAILTVVDMKGDVRSTV